MTTSIPAKYSFKLGEVSISLPRKMDPVQQRRIYTSGAEQDRVVAASDFGQTQTRALLVWTDAADLQSKIFSVERDAPEEVLETVAIQREQLQQLKEQLLELQREEFTTRFTFVEATREVARQLVGVKVWDAKISPLLGVEVSVDELDEAVVALLIHYDLMVNSDPAEAVDADTVVEDVDPLDFSKSV